MYSIGQRVSTQQCVNKPVYSFCCVSVTTVTANNQTALMAHLFTNYESRVRPVCGVDRPIEVKVGLAIRQIIELVRTPFARCHCNGSCQATTPFPLAWQTCPFIASALSSHEYLLSLKNNEQGKMFYNLTLPRIVV